MERSELKRTRCPTPNSKQLIDGICSYKNLFCWITYFLYEEEGTKSHLFKKKAESVNISLAQVNFQCKYIWDSSTICKIKSSVEAGLELQEMFGFVCSNKKYFYFCKSSRKIFFKSSIEVQKQKCTKILREYCIPTLIITQKMIRDRQKTKK